MCDQILLNAIDNQTIDLCGVKSLVDKWLETVAYTLSAGLTINDFDQTLKIIAEYDVCQVQLVNGLYRALLNDSLQADALETICDYLLGVLNSPNVDQTDKDMYAQINDEEFVTMWNTCIALAKRQPRVLAAYLFAWGRADDEKQDMIVDGLCGASKYTGLLVDAVKQSYPLVHKTSIFLCMLAVKLEIQFDRAVDYTTIFDRLYDEDPKRLLKLVRDEDAAARFQFLLRHRPFSTTLLELFNSSLDSKPMGMGLREIRDFLVESFSFSEIPPLYMISSRIAPEQTVVQLDQSEMISIKATVSYREQLGPLALFKFVKAQQIQLGVDVVGQKLVIHLPGETHEQQIPAQDN